MRNYKLVLVEENIYDLPEINKNDKFLQFLSSKLIGEIDRDSREVNIYEEPLELYYMYDKDVRFWGEKGYYKVDNIWGFIIKIEKDTKDCTGFYEWIIQQEILFKDIYSNESA